MRHISTCSLRQKIADLFASEQFGTKIAMALERKPGSSPNFFPESALCIAGLSCSLGGLIALQNMGSFCCSNDALECHIQFPSVLAACGYEGPSHTRRPGQRVLERLCPTLQQESLRSAAKHRMKAHCRSSETACLPPTPS